VPKRIGSGRSRIMEINIRAKLVSRVKYGDLLGDIYVLCENHGLEVQSLSLTSKDEMVSSSFLPVVVDPGDVIDAEEVFEEEPKREVLLDEDIK
jgi:hypothetical protein